MRTQLIGGGSILLAALLASSASAQNVARVAPIPGAVKNAGTYHVATGEWTRAQQTYGILTQDVLYRNDRASGYFGLLDENEYANDEGRLPGDGSPVLPGQTFVGTADTYTINGFQFGYCATSTTQASYQLGFREVYDPCQPATGLGLDADFLNTGLPNGGCWIVAIDLIGTTLTFDIDADGADGNWDNSNDLDNFGYRLRIDHDQGDGTGQLIAGPILAGNNTAAASYGDGTKFKNPAAADGTGLGTEDLFWLESPVVADGCYWYGGCIPCANFNTVFYGEDAGGPISYCSSAANSISAGGGQLASTGGYNTAAAGFNVTAVPNQPGILYTGLNAISINPFGCGERCVGGSITRFGPFVPAGNTLNVTINMTSGAGNKIQYWYRDPNNFMACGDVFNLTNALQ